MIYGLYISSAHRDDEEGGGGLDGVGVVGGADDALGLGPAGARCCAIGRELREVHELPDEPGHLLVGVAPEEVLAAGVLAVGEGADLEGEAEVDDLLEAVLGLVLLQVLVVQRLDADDLGEGDGVEEGLLVDGGEGDDVGRDRDPLWPPVPVKFRRY